MPSGGSLANQPKDSIQIKRILKQGQHYLCGICRQRYVRRADALSCLKSCAKNFLQSTTVSEFSEKGARKYRCQYCKRSYLERAIALECASACRSKAQNKLDREKKFQHRHLPPEKLRLLEAMSGNSPVLQSAKKKASNGQKSQPTACQVCGKMYPSSEKARICQSRHKLKGESSESIQSASVKAKTSVEAETHRLKPKTSERAQIPKSARKPKPAEKGTDNLSNQGQQSEPSSNISSQENEYFLKAQKIDAKKDADKFTRNGAKYVCRICSHQFFTKVEVVDCYDGHLNPESDSRETPSPQAIDDVSKEAEKVKLFKVDRTDGDKKFYRNGAKYVCRSCKKGYFTRSEAIECFDSDQKE